MGEVAVKDRGKSAREKPRESVNIVNISSYTHRIEAIHVYSNFSD